MPENGGQPLDGYLTKTGHICHYSDMPVSRNTQNISVSLITTPEMSAGVIYGLQEVFACVGTMWNNLMGDCSVSRQMRPRVVGRTTEPVRTTMGSTLVSDHTFSEAHQTDVVIAGDVILPLDAGPAGLWDEEVQWLKEQYDKGAIICSVCTGSLLLAEAGLLDGLEATSHWSATGLFQKYYPKVLLKPECILLPAGVGHRIITSGGSASWNDLALYLIARFCGEEEARNIAKIFLFGDRSDGQLPFSAMVRPKQDVDLTIAKCQEWIADHYALGNPVERMAEQSGLTARTFKRRFHSATGYAPLDYVQTLRIEEAKHILETTDTPIDDIAELVGYMEPNSFRRLFKRTTGITPHQYRVRFKTVVPIQAGSA